MTNPQGSLEFSPLVWVLIVLLVDVRADLLQLESDRGHRVPPRPEMFPCKFALLPPKRARNRNGALAFQELDHLRPRHLGRNGNTHMDMIGHDMALDNLTLFLARQRMEDGTQVPPNLARQLPPPSFRDKDYMILALPAGMRQALIIVFHSVLLSFPHQTPPPHLLPYRPTL